jgi:hypothetical protein
MLISILQHTPFQVWIIFVILISFGISLSLPRRRTLRSAVMIPVVMIAMSCYGVVAGFSHQAPALAAWATGVVASLMHAHITGAWSGIRWSEKHRRLIIPGSWGPMILMMGLFATKYIANVLLAISPELKFDLGFMAVAGFSYGAFSGAFLARGVVMWKVAHKALQPSHAC